MKTLIRMQTRKASACPDARRPGRDPTGSGQRFAADQMAQHGDRRPSGEHLRHPPAAKLRVYPGRTAQQRGDASAATAPAGVEEFRRCSKVESPR